MTLIRPARARRVLAFLAFLAVVVPAAVLLVPAPGAAAAQPPPPQTVTVPISGFAYLPADLTVHVGDTVTWVNEDRAPHDVTTTNGPVAFASETLNQGQSYSYTFTAPGAYSYMCTIHPNMVATVTVIEHAPPPPPAPEPPPAEEAPTAEAPAAEAPPAPAVPPKGAPADGAVTTAPDVPPSGAPAAPAPAGGAAPTDAQPEPGTTQLVGAAQQGPQLNPLLIVAAVALGVTTLCLLLVTAPPATAAATGSSGAVVGGMRRPGGVAAALYSDHRERGPVNLALRMSAAAGLAIDAYVHFDLAADYDVVGSTITQGTLFRAQAVVALLAALLILLVGRTWVYQVVFLVAISALAPLVLYTYVDVGAVGPLPNMYEPVWYQDKTFSAVGEAVAAVAAAALLVWAWRRRDPSPASTGIGSTGTGSTGTGSTGTGQGS